MLSAPASRRSSFLHHELISRLIANCSPQEAEKRFLTPSRLQCEVQRCMRNINRELSRLTFRAPTGAPCPTQRPRSMRSRDDFVIFDKKSVIPIWHQYTAVDRLLLEFDRHCQLAINVQRVSSSGTRSIMDTNHGISDNAH